MSSTTINSFSDLGAQRQVCQRPTLDRLSQQEANSVPSGVSRLALLRACPGMRVFIITEQRANVFAENTMTIALSTEYTPIKLNVLRRSAFGQMPVRQVPLS